MTLRLVASAPEPEKKSSIYIGKKDADMYLNDDRLPINLT